MTEMQIKFMIDSLEAKKKYYEVLHKNGKIGIQTKLTAISELNKEIRKYKEQI